MPLYSSLSWVARDTNVRRGTEEGCVSPGMVLDVCFHGACGGSVDRGVIHPSTMLRPNGHKLP